LGEHQLFDPRGDRVLQMLGQFPEAQVESDPGHHLFWLERLGDIVDRPCVKPFHLLALIFQDADEDNGNGTRPFIRFEPAAHFVAVHARHLDIQQDEVREDRPDKPQRQLAVGGRVN
jgi:hypothetical protein